jgi:hypothetical protein
MRNALALFVLIAGATSLFGQPVAGWRLSGSNEILVEQFDVSGDQAPSPFRIDGTFLTNRLSLNLDWTDQSTRELSIRTEILGTDSDYLPEQGLVVATLALRFENGAAALPYRIEAGDVFADLSRRLLQRQIRGTSLEFQPPFGIGTHSVVVVTGSGAPDWLDTFRAGDDLYFTAASWLWQSASEKTSIVANVSSESARAGAEGAFPQAAVDRDHLLTSVSAKTSLGGIDVEGEVSVLDGDEENGTSFYAEAGRGEGMFTWRIRYEDNDEHYLPLGAMGIMAGRSIGEIQARWRPSPRGSLRARLQQFDQRFAGSSREVSTDAAALSWESQPLGFRPSFHIEATADLNRIESNDRLQDLLFRNFGLELRDDFAGRFDLTYRGWFRDTRDDAQSAFDRRAVTQELVAGRPFRLSTWSGRLGGGVGFRSDRESASSDTWSPMIEASLRNGNHLLRAHYGLVQQDFLIATVGDLDYQNRRILYTWARANHNLSLEYGQELREPERSLDTDSRRLALRYRYAFDQNL